LPGRDLSLLVDAAQEAGRIASRYFQHGADRWDKPAGAGPVTEADLAVNSMLSSELRNARPDFGWLSEESEDGPDRTQNDSVFIIDLIDGTRSFIEGSRAWAHSLAGERIAASCHATPSGATLLAAKPALAPLNWASGTPPPFKREHRPSLAYRLCLVAEGRYDAMLTLRKTWEWDIAAGDLVLREAGAVTSDRRRNRLRFNNRQPQVDGCAAAGPMLHASMMEALA
jgi:myo-inositol-1(or 4)-monophosphatase